MVWRKYKLPILITPIICILIYFFIYHLFISLNLSLIIIGAIYGIIFAIHQSKPHTIVHSKKIKTKYNIVKWIIEQIQIPSKLNIKENLSIKQKTHIDLDTIIDEICDLFLEDIILSWYKNVSNEQITFIKAFKQEIHQIVTNLKTRCASIDWVTVLSNDLVVLFSEHYREVRQAILDPVKHQFRLHAFLKSEENEVEFLQTLSESLIFLLLPPSFSSTSAIKYLLREIFVFRVLKSTINQICEPDYFNENILLKIEQLNINNEHKLRKFTLASNYETFIQLIETSNDRDKLEQFWNYIVTEIMQATAIKNLKKEGVISSAHLGTKGELLMNRDLTKYLNQLRRAKIVCERAITANGGRSYLLVDADTNKANLANRKILSLNMILSCVTGRVHLHQFLETFGTQALIKFWYDVWNLREAPSHERHRVATNIYKVYITRFGSAVRDEIDNATVRRMKTFLVGEQAEPDAFYYAQTIVYGVFQHDYYASFLVSKQYDALCRAFNADNLQDFDLKEQLLGWSNPIATDENFDETDDNHPLQSSESSENVPKYLADLRDQLANKQYALTAATEASTFDETVLKTLENDCADLKSEINTLERLLENVDRWWSYLGQWRVQILNSEFKEIPFCIAAKIESPDIQEGQGGWVVTRTLPAWQHFYRRLKELQPLLPVIDLFRSRRQTFSQLQHDKILAEELFEQLGNFLQKILSDEHMSSYEFVYQFLNYSPLDNDQRSTNSSIIKKKSTNENLHRFSLSQLFRSDKTSNDLSETDSVRFLEGRADSIAKPFYQFIDILFEDQGALLKLIRMTLVQFIRVTYGSTINRQVRRYIVTLFQEERVVNYLTMLRSAIWSKKPRVEKLTRTEDEKFERRQQAKRQLLTNIPETMSLIFGSDNARLGTERLFELFQDIRLNKHLCYKLLMLIMNEIFPELRMRL